LGLKLFDQIPPLARNVDFPSLSQQVTAVPNVERQQWEEVTWKKIDF